MKISKLLMFAYIAIIAFFVVQCKKEVNVFTVNQDMQFGEEMDSVILADYNVLSKSANPDAYTHIERIMGELLQSDDLKYTDKFNWTVRIIDDEVLNAFATPGGYMYFYTGIIKYLDSESSFAGVMAHEMAHCDKRHSTKTMTKMYGYSTLVQMILGKEPNQFAALAADLALGLGNLKFSREHEYEADKMAVTYLYDTDYDPKGIADFFIKLQAEEASGRSPEFFSTHPDPGNRVEAIETVWTEMGSQQGEKFTTRYQEFQASLP